MVTTDEILDAISEMNEMQVQELVKGLEDKFGITAAAPVAVAAAAPAGDCARLSMGTGSTHTVTPSGSEWKDLGVGALDANDWGEYECGTPFADRSGNTPPEAGAKETKLQEIVLNEDVVLCFAS